MALRIFAQFRFVHLFCHYLDPEVQHMVTHALVMSQLDYCNVLCMGLSLKIIRKLQLVQNAAACTVPGAPRAAQITQLLHKLHWLPDCFWIQFMMLVVTFKALYGMDPGYLRAISRQWASLPHSCQQKRAATDPIC